MSSKKVFLDTNFLLIPFEFKIDVFSELNYLIESNFQIFLPSGVISELKKLAKGRGKEGLAAKFALKIVAVYLEKKKISKIRSSGYVDDWLFYTGKNDSNAIICTNDTRLRRKLKSARIPVITMKSRSKVGFI